MCGTGIAAPGSPWYIIFLPGRVKQSFPAGIISSSLQHCSKAKCLPSSETDGSQMVPNQENMAIVLDKSTMQNVVHFCKYSLLPTFKVIYELLNNALVVNKKCIL